MVRRSHEIKPQLMPPLPLLSNAELGEPPAPPAESGRPPPWPPPWPPPCPYWPPPPPLPFPPIPELSACRDGCHGVRPWLQFVVLSPSTSQTVRVLAFFDMHVVLTVLPVSESTDVVGDPPPALQAALNRLTVMPFAPAADFASAGLPEMVGRTIRAAAIAEIMVFVEMVMASSNHDVAPRGH